MGKGLYSLCFLDRGTVGRENQSPVEFLLVPLKLFPVHGRAIPLLEHEIIWGHIVLLLLGGGFPVVGEKFY